MPRSREAGFSLVELLVALVIFVLVAFSLYNVLNVSQRTSRTQTEKAAMQGSLRTGIQLAIAELQEIWTDAGETDGAITATSSTALSYRAMRGLGLTCAPLVSTTITVDAEDWEGLVTPVAGQGVYLYDEGPSDITEDDDTWLDGTITNVANGACTTNGNAAYVLTVTGIGSVATVQVPGPARLHEAMQLGLVASGGRNWLGLGVAGGALTPLAGPLNSTGLLIEYKDEDGATAATITDVKSIILRLYGETQRAANRNFSGTTEILGDTMVVRVQLRNGR